MIKELHTLIAEFAGSPSHMCCFLHIINLIAKMLINQFDTKKTMVEVDSELVKIGKELDEDEHLLDEIVVCDEEGEVEENTDEWVDKMEVLDMEEQNWLERSICPVKLVLVKVRQCLDQKLAFGSNPFSSINSLSR